MHAFQLLPQMFPLLSPMGFALQALFGENLPFGMLAKWLEALCLNGAVYPGKGRVPRLLLFTSSGIQIQSHLLVSLFHREHSNHFPTMARGDLVSCSEKLSAVVWLFLMCPC